MKVLSRLPIALGLFLAFVVVLLLSAWIYTSTVLAFARSGGVYPSVEQGTRSRIARYYRGIDRVDILNAGPESFDGSNPHVWYVIAEVRAAAHLDGSSLGEKGCDAPGWFFLQTRQGWVQVPEGAFPKLLGFWMKVFGMAGAGQSTPSTEWAPSQPDRFCQ